MSEQLNERSQFLYLGHADIPAGRSRIGLVLGGQTPAPGSGGPPLPIGPLVLNPVANEDPPVVKLPADRAEELCGRHFDWVEAIP